MARVTVKMLEAFTPTEHGKVFRENGGLVGKVRAGVKGVTVLFRYEFSLGGKKNDYALGSWPKSTLADIRAKRDQARVSVAQGVDPGAANKAARIEAKAAIASTIAQEALEASESLTVADMFTAWVRDGVSRKDDNLELKRRFEKDVLPAIGKTVVKELTEADLLTLLRRVKSRGVKDDPQRNMNRSLEILHSDIGQMLRWAEKRQPWRMLMAQHGNPADLIDITTLLDDDYQTERDRILTEAEIRELKNRFQQLEDDYISLSPGQKYSGIRPVNTRTQCALWICLSTLCRIGELLMSRWEDVDLQAGTWFIPATNTKAHKGKKQEHHIVLSPFAVQQFKRLFAETGHTDYCFPSRDAESHVCVKTVSKLVGDRQVRFKKRSKPLSGRHHNDSLILSGGKNGGWTPHDLRRTGATMMQELQVPLDVIDRCQNHVMEGSKVRRHYLKYNYAEEKSAAWLALGKRLEEILKS